MDIKHTHTDSISSKTQI